MILDLLWVFMTGLAGSLHCVGMCGPLVAAYAVNLRVGPSHSPVPRNPWSMGLLYHHGVFHLGRIAAYALMGALAAGFVHLAGFSESLHGLRTMASVAGGLLMIILGLILLRVIPLPFTVSTAAGNIGERGFRGRRSILRRIFGKLLGSQGFGSRWATGFAAGFLPCMLSWAMVAKAAATGNTLAGLSVMTLFGLGTVPALLLVGFFASFFTLRLRLTGERIAALSVIVMGLILLWKGVTHLG